MIHYHGGPITPIDVAVKVWKGSHAFVSFMNPEQVDTAAAICQTFALDNGAFSRWTQGNPSNYWGAYYSWVEKWMYHPGFDFAVIPDVIDGNEDENDELIDEWEYGIHGAPVWHMHESIERLKTLCGQWPRVCIGSSGIYTSVGSTNWWAKIDEAMNAICINGRPICKLHGLRMLDPNIFQHLPLSSADSTNVARNHHQKRSAYYIIKQRIEAQNSCMFWSEHVLEKTSELF